MSSAATRLQRVLLGASTIALVAGMAALLAACPGSLENKDAFLDASACGDVPKTIIGARCATSNCHDSQTHQSNIDMTPDDGLAGRLVGVMGDQCAGLLIDPDVPEDSLMYTKCLANPTCGVQMPFTGAKLTAEEEQCLLEWVTSAAQ